MIGVECEGIDWIYNIGAIARSVGLAMAFERVFTGLGFWRGIEPFDGDTTFNGGGSVAVIVGHAGYGASHEFEGGFSLLPGFLGGISREGERIDVEKSGGHGDYKSRGCEGEGVRFGGEGDCCWELRRVGEVVNMEGLVPGSGYE